MGNKSPQTEHIREYQQRPKWQHQPSKVMRVPDCFADQVLEFAKGLDEGRPIEAEAAPQKALLEQLRDCDLTQLLEIERALPRLIRKARKAARDSRLEDAILFLVGRCDGARAKDGQGFNAYDAPFGRWLAGRIEAEQPLLSKHAAAALNMLQRYVKQLAEGGIELPEWDAIAHQYPSRIHSQFAQAERHIEVTDNQIAVFAPYDKTGTFQKQAKSIEGYKFDGISKGWFYPLGQVEAVVAEFPAEDGYEIAEEVTGTIAMLQTQRAEAEAQQQAEIAEKASSIIRLIEAAQLDSPLPCGWNLFEHQRTGVEWLLGHTREGIYRGGILADDMGLGKTIEALVAAKAIATTHNCPILVICPASLRDNWAIEAGNIEIAIETFSWAKMPKPLDSQKYVLIADEAHKAQNPKAKRTQNLWVLAEHFNCLAAWLLTGTPSKHGRPANLWPLLKAVGHPLGADRWEFEKYYCNARHKQIGDARFWDNTGAAHMDELAQKTQDVILRRKKSECLDLPEKLRTLKPAELQGKELREYKWKIQAELDDYRDRVKRGEVSPDAEALVRLNVLRKIGSQYKAAAAIEMVEELLEQGQQAVVFTEFKDSARAVYAAFTEIGAELLTGDTPTQERQALVERFQAGTAKVFIGTIQAGGVGLTLTAASNVILVDRPWSPGDCDQAEDRCHRIGQKSTVHAHWIQLGLIDQSIDGLIHQKQVRIEQLMRGKRKTLRGLSSPKELAKELLKIL